MEIIRIFTIEELQIETLLKESAQENFTMLEQLLDAYQNNTSTFQAANERLLVAMDEYGRYLGIASLTQSHLVPSCGIVNHLYVLPTYRKMGVGYELMQWLIRTARDYYATLEIHGDFNANTEVFLRNRGFKAVSQRLMHLSLDPEMKELFRE